MQRHKQCPLTRIVLWIAAGVLTAASVSAGRAGGRQNVLFIAIDDLRPELGCYGAEHIRSPNIDKLASRGVLFERAYCQAPHCGPSRASLLSGVHTRNYDGIPMNPATLAPGKPTLPAVLRRAGYHTVGNGKIYHQRDDDAVQSWSEPPFSLVNGPKENNHLTFHDKESANYIQKKKNRGPFFEAPDVPDNAYIDGQTCEKTIEDMRRLAKMDKPFFLACGFVRPHLPFYAPRKYWDLYDRAKIALADNRYMPKNAPSSLRGSGEVHSYHDRDIKYNSTEFHRIARHGYYACVSYADALVGKLLATLDELELGDSTIVVVWGDHGWHLGEHNFWGKHNLLHNSTNAPLIISAPGFRKGVKTQGIVELVDLYPTLCELAGVDPPEHLEGKSMVPLLRDPQLPGKAAALTKWRNGLVATTRDFTYTEYSNGQRMLYDRRTDPEENVNVAADPDYAETVKEMKQLLRGEQDEASDAKTATEAVTAPDYEGNVPMPTLSEVRYGEHGRHTLDFWQAESDKPTPLVFVIHGGGWSGGSKERMSRFADANALLKAGISVVAINYRLMKHSQDVVPPVKAPLHDAARALQFVRSKAAEWNIDKTRIGAAGGSAGACSSLWLAYHDDLADPDRPDPVARESTRLHCIGVMGAQTTLDPQQMKEWTPNSRYGGHAFGKKGFPQFLAARETILPWIAEYSPYALASKGDPPVAIFYGAAPAMGKAQKDPTHTANFGIGLQRRCQELGIACQVVYPGAADVKHQTPTDYLIEALLGSEVASSE